ncbi:sulfatase-like hydrolase/transferase [Microvirga sp. BT689]|nr:sulfatase-like hydrolase/transferase [Microvirga arvi]
MMRNLGLGLLVSAASVIATPATAQQQKPNIVVIMADDIGFWNISAYNRGMMGYRTPNIDRIANESAIFKDYYGQQSCTASMLFNLRSDLFERTSFDREAEG